jgi:Mg-chelatase subunit ChlD
LLAQAKDRVSRGLIAVCIARVPREDATEKLLEMARTERDPLVRVVAWQGVLGRAGMLSEDQYRRWLAITPGMVKADYFRGELRLSVVHVLATAPPDRGTKEAWNTLFIKAVGSTREAETVEALCACAAAWRAPDVMDGLVRKLVPARDVERADALLRSMGSTAQVDAKGTLAEHAKWWARERQNWKPRTDVAAGAWKLLTPQFVPAPVPLERVNPDDPTWRKDLELRAPNLKAFDVAFCVDATGSMGSVLDWLKRDVSRMMQGFAAVALEPRIGLTFYRDHGDEFVAVTRPLTHRVNELQDALGAMTAAGGGDIPEAVLDGLNDCYNSNHWTTAKDGRKVVVLIGDAPPHRETQAECARVAHAAAERGFKLYAVKCDKELAEFDVLAAAGGGASLEVDMAELAAGRRGKAFGGMTGLNGTPAAPAGRRLLGMVLVDVINPQFRERVEPLVSVLWEMLEETPTRP